jgi:DNA-binding MarR family transcriptional regulator
MEKSSGLWSRRGFEQWIIIAGMKKSPAHKNPVGDQQAQALDEGIAALLQRFKLEPSIAAGSPYASLHANDVGLLMVIRGPERWNVRGIARSLGAPISTISSALDRLEKRGLLARLRGPGDRRVVQIELTPAGHRLIAKIRGQQVEVCRDMLACLGERDRDEMIRLVALLASG